MLDILPVNQFLYDTEMMSCDRGKLPVGSEEKVVPLLILSSRTHARDKLPNPSHI